MEKSAAYDKFLPEPTSVSKPFWDACKRHELNMQYCSACENWIWYPRALCPLCGKRDRIEWRKLSGKGTIYSFTVIRQVIDNSPSFQKDLPFVIGLIDLEEGPRMYSNVRGENVAIGDLVQLYFDDVTPEISLPKFEK